ncbi:hypothetical protein C8Q74DRAFT_1313610 [Fomes fomentarius]|nr:hypothetical protein C8Q74DRAFT_1313610 [Fomes fomentarius]
MDFIISSIRLVESIPHLGDALTVAKHVAEFAKVMLNMPQEIKDVKDEVRLLAERANVFTEAVYQQLNTGAVAVDVATTPEHVKALLDTLKEIEILVERRTKKKLQYYLLPGRPSKTKDEVTRLSKKLDEACQVFQVQSSVHTQQQLSAVTYTQARLVEHADNTERVQSDLLQQARGIDSNVTNILHRIEANQTHDGTLRLLGRDDIELLEDLGPESPIDESGERPTRYRARLCATGSVVTVRRFPRADDRFQAEVETAKKIWHPNVEHAVGYSKPDPYAAFIVNGGFHTRTFNELSRTFHGLERLLWTMRFAGLMHLKEIRKDLIWTPDEDMQPIQADHELLVSEDGQVLLDVSFYRVDRLPNTLIHDDGMVEFNSQGRELVKGVYAD